jgi:hypothetical protein
MQGLGGIYCTWMPCDQHQSNGALDDGLTVAEDGSWPCLGHHMSLDFERFRSAVEATLADIHVISQCGCLFFLTTIQATLRGNKDCTAYERSSETLPSYAR